MRKSNERVLKAAYDAKDQSIWDEYDAKMEN